MTGVVTACRLAAIVGLGLAVSGCTTTDPTGVDGPIMHHIAPPSGDDEDAEIRGLIEISEGCVYVALDEVSERYPVVWPRGTSWDSDIQAVVLPSGELLAAGDAVYGGGGYRYVDDIEQVVGPEAAALAEACVDNTYGEIAVVNNSASAIGPGQ